MDKLIYTWEDYTADMKIIQKKIEGIESPHLVSLYRGSLPMGVHLSNVMNLPLSIVDLQTRDGDGSGPKLIKNAGINATCTLVILDDIYDKGLTMNKTREMFHQERQYAKIVGITLHSNSEMAHLHKNYDDWVHSLNDSKGKWVSYPWEVL